MTLDLLVAYCKVKEELIYRTKIPVNECFEDIKGYCCLDAVKCLILEKLEK